MTLKRVIVPAVQSSRPEMRRVLNAGSGPYSPRKLHSAFTHDLWEEIRVDIDPRAKPNIVSSITDLSQSCASESFDAVWCSHILEHLYMHEVFASLREFNRILKSDGFLLISCPDLEAVADLVVRHGLDHIAYQSPAGPITPLDMLFGHTASITRGNTFMAHNTGFTCASLGRILVEADFPTVLVRRGKAYDLWALALMPQCHKRTIQEHFYAHGLDMRENGT